MNRHRLLLSALVVTGVASSACTSAPAARPSTPPAPASAVAPPSQPEEPPMPVADTIRVTQTATPQELVFPQEAFRAKQPEAGAPRPFRLPKIKPFTLKSGMKVYLVEQHTLPLVSMDLNFDGGGLVDPPGKEGLSSVCMAMLTEGTARLDKIQYAEALADVASSIHSYAADDSHGITLNSLSKHLDATFALLVETLREPGLRASDFERMIQRRIEGVRQSKGNPASVAGRVSGPVLYGAHHPYGKVTTEQSLQAITLDDCKAHAAAWLKPGNARLFVVGDLTEAQLRQLFDRGALASWKGKTERPRPLPKPSGPKGRIFFVHVPGAAQSQVAMLHFGPRRTAADYFANSLMAAVFGGGFSSRINMNLREDKGYSYGARGGFSYSKAYGTFSASASVRTDATYQTLLEMTREVKELWKGARPVRKDELEREKLGAILGLPGRFATGQAALGQYRSLVYFGLPLDYYGSYVGKVEKVTEAQVRAAAQRHLKPGQAVYLVVGDGDAKVIARVQEKDPSTGKDVWKDVPYAKDGTQLTLREALAELAVRGDVGQGGLIELDADGNPLR